MPMRPWIDESVPATAAIRRSHDQLPGDRERNDDRTKQVSGLRAGDEQQREREKKQDDAWNHHGVTTETSRWDGYRPERKIRWVADRKSASFA